MRIIFGADAIFYPLTGIGHYALQLARGLRNHPEISELRYFAGWRWLADPERALAANRSLAAARRHVPCKSLALHLYHATSGAILRWRTRRLPTSLFHAPNFILPQFAGPSVATIHDLSHLRYPQFHPPERTAYLNRHLPRTLRQASRLIAVSEFVRQDIHQQLGVPLARMATVHNGVDPVFHPRLPAETRSTLTSYGLADLPYLLVVATLEPRKNLKRTVAAYGRLPIALRRQHLLVLAGASGWLTGDLERQIAPLERAGQVCRLGYVPQDDLPLLYAGAFAFAYPSLYEGFGLPPLEALASGVPTLISDRASLPEVIGDAALQVDPENVDELTAGLERLLADNDWRATARERGLRQAHQFSWTRCVEETVAVYRAIWEEQH